MFRRLLVGFDGSAMANEAIGSALRLASDLSGEVAVIAVTPVARGGNSPEQAETQAIEGARLRALADERLRQASHSQIHWSVEVIEATEPSATLRSVFQNRGFDLIVLGRNGAGRGRRGGLGHVPRQLIEKSHAPVLVVGEANT